MSNATAKGKVVVAMSGGVDHRADVFSLGALFYEALVMARPFEGDTTLQIVEKLKTFKR